MNGSCHCGRVTIRIPGRPEFLNVCNCTLCTKMGGIWGYFPADQVEIEGQTQAYVRDDIDQYLATHFCGHCGATTHWKLLEGGDLGRIGVNMRLFEPEELIGIEVRYGNRRDDYEGERRYYREPTVFAGVGVTP